MFQPVMGWRGTMADSDRRRVQLADVRSFVGDVYGADLHAKRIDSLAGATLGVMQSASLAVAMIGQALAQARGLITKHAVKQVDRMLSNYGYLRIRVKSCYKAGQCRIWSCPEKLTFADTTVCALRPELTKRPQSYSYGTNKEHWAAF